MAVTAYTGPPGAGKSYALVSQVILPALEAGRRVVTNVDGCNPDAFAAYLEAKGVASPGSLHLFQGDRALVPGFFPTKDRPSGCLVQPGDLLVFDEWRLTFLNRGAVGNPDLEPFLRWHRHLVDDRGQSCDVVIGSQLITDIHRDFRGLVERSYKFRKLSAVGAPKFYRFDVYEGHEQRKGSAFRTGQGSFKKEIFALYKSFETDGEAFETATDRRATLFSRGFIALGVVALFLMVGGGFYSYSWLFRGEPASPGPASTPAPVPSGSVQYLPPLPTAQAQSSVGSLRIVGTISADQGEMVIIADKKGAMRALHARDFVFENGRPVSGLVDGVRVYAEDFTVSGPPGPGPGLGLGL